MERLLILDIIICGFYFISFDQPFTGSQDGPKMISRTITVCGFLNLADIGSPMSLSRHLIMPNENPSVAQSSGSTDAEKLANDIAAFYSKGDDEENGEQKSSVDDSACVLLHGALKFDNLAAVVQLNDDWFGFMHSFSDSKRKSNIILTILPPGEFSLITIM